MSTAYANIDLNLLRFNAKRVMEKAGRARLMAVVKADAYGHGAVEVARTLSEIGVDFLAVMTVDEAVLLRDAGIGGRLLVMGSLIPAEMPRYDRYGLDATVGSAAALDAVCGAAVPAGLPVHLKVDSGMGRLGVQPTLVHDALERLRKAGAIELVGVSTHLASADADDIADAVRQVERFKGALAGESLDDLIVHIANTEALARVPSAYQRFPNAMVRIGIGLYGCPTRRDTRNTLRVKPIMTLRALVTNVKKVDAGSRISYGGRWVADRETTIATVGIGYADGYFRCLRGRSVVGVEGTRRPVVGTICMDMIMVDLTDNQEDVVVGDHVTLFGEGGPDVSEVAAWAETIPYEITSGLGFRVERRFS